MDGGGKLSWAKEKMKKLEGHVWWGPWLMYLPFSEEQVNLGAPQAKLSPRFSHTLRKRQVS